MAVPSFPQLQQLPAALKSEGAITIELVEGVPVLRAAVTVQQRIQVLLHKQQDTRLTVKEQRELDQYELMDDYLSLLNRIVRNSLQARK
jgi:hypothetical protein